MASVSDGDYELFVAQSKLLAWNIFAKGLMILAFLEVSAEGLRVAIPAVGKRLHKVSFLGFLKELEAFHKMDIAFIFAGMLLIATWTMLPEFIHGMSDFRNEGPRWRTFQHRTVAQLLAMFLVFIDVCLFYTGVVRMSWGASMFSITGVLGTAAYVAVAFYVSYVSVGLKKDVNILKGGLR